MGHISLNLIDRAVDRLRAKLEPDGALQLPGLLGENGFMIRSARPHIFCLRPSDYMWQWPATFIETYL
jgi:hypothetical protein